MKRTITSLFSHAFRDRWFTGLTILNIILLLVVLVTLLMTIEPKETQVMTQYTIFGTTNHYRGYWYTLWTYGLLELVMVFGHLALAAKLMELGRREFAMGLLWLTLVLSTLVLLVSQSVIKIASLG